MTVNNLGEKTEGASSSENIPTDEIDLTYLIELSQMPGIEKLSSDLTEEQRQKCRDATWSRMQMYLGHRNLPRRWVIQYGWPKMLDVIKEYAQKNNIKLVGHP